MVFFQQWKSLSRISFLRPSQHRWNYQIFIEKVRNKKTGKLEMEDTRKYFLAAPDMNLHSDPSKADLLQYEKPWMKRKRKKQNRLYNKKAHNVADLMAFIKVKQGSTKKNK
mmetsp:Transcript_14134/g.21572  ORF Transcript_14134/g.21572 Transcript_14134/m.21572 type:complete len:111 (+) Transcript_14134:153-485(+)